MFGVPVPVTLTVILLVPVLVTVLGSIVAAVVENGAVVVGTEPAEVEMDFVEFLVVPFRPDEYAPLSG